MNSNKRIINKHIYVQFEIFYVKISHYNILIETPQKENVPNVTDCTPSGVNLSMKKSHHGPDDKVRIIMMCANSLSNWIKFVSFWVIIYEIRFSLIILPNIT